MYNMRFYFFVVLLPLTIFCWSTCTGSNYIPMWSCDFDNGLCHWLQNHDDEFDWEFEDGVVHDLYDHTKLLGKYLSIHNQHARDGDKASLMSPTLRPSNGSCKMIFYHVHKNSHPEVQAVLEVFLVTAHDRKSIYRSSVNYNTWKKEELSLLSHADFQVEIVATAGDLYEREIALDDVLFTDDCLTTEKSSFKAVKLSKSPQHNFPEGLFFEKQNNSWSKVCTKERAKLACMQLGLSDVLTEYSTSSGYYSGQKICQPGNISAPVSLSCSSSSSCNETVYWKCKQSYISVCPSLTHSSCTSSGANAKCFAKSKLCDFVNDCHGGEDESSCFNNKRCDFKTGTCDWIASKNTLFEWERYHGMTDGSSSQFYMRVDTSHAPSTTATARLKMLHAVKGQNNSACWLRFYYHVSGSWRGSLKLIVKQNITEKSIWTVTRTGRRGEINWRRKALELPKSPLYHIIFQASHVGTVRIGEFGLNNISFSSSCRFENFTRVPSNNSATLFHCKSGEFVQKTLVCDFKADCYDGSDELNCAALRGRCNFDSSYICGWTIGENSMSKMIRQYGRTPSYYTGPNKDHTNKFKSGYYMYLEATNLKKGDQGYLLSNVLPRPKSGNCTFRWFYHMYDAYETYGMGKLQILLYYPLTKTTRLLWTKQYNQGSSWNFGSVSFGVDFFEFQIMILAERGQFYRSDIAIDDVSFSDDCYEVSHVSAPVVTQNCSIAGGTFYTVTQNGGTINSPSYRNVREPLTCSWHITVPNGFRIYLESSFIKMKCGNCHMGIQANNSKANSDLISSNRPPFHLVSSSNSLKVDFFAQYANSDYQFQLNFSTTTAPAKALSDVYDTTSPGTPMLVSVRRNCRNVIDRQYFSSGSGTITSVKNRNSIDCTYTFVGTKGYRFSIHFTSFNTEHFHDFVEVIDGILDSPKKRFSGNLQPFHFVTTSNVFRLRYKTDFSVVSEGFVLSFALTSKTPSLVTYPTTIAPSLSSTQRQHTTTGFSTEYISISCQGMHADPRLTIRNASDTWGTIVSPNYPFPYEHSVNCIWTSRNLIQGKRFILEFSTFNTEPKYDYVVVRDGDSLSAPRLKTLSGFLNNPQVIRTSSNAFTVQFVTDSSTSSSGFVLSYSTYPGCYKHDLVARYSLVDAGKGDVKQCIKECNKYRDRYAAFSQGNCYCGNSQPSTYSLYLRHPSECLSCQEGKYKCGGPLTASVYFSSDADDSKTGSQARSTSGAIAGSLTSLAAVVLVFIVFCYYKKKKRHTSTSPRARGGSNTNRNTGGISNEGVSRPVAFYVPFAQQDALPERADAPPAYNDVIQGRVFFFNQLYGPATTMTPLDILEAPPSFNEAIASQTGSEMPPKYDTLQQLNTNAGPVPVPIQVLGAEASAPPERNSSPIPPKPDSGRVSLPPLNTTENHATYNSNSLLGNNQSRSGFTNLVGESQRPAVGYAQARHVRNLPPINRSSARENPAFTYDEV